MKNGIGNGKMRGQAIPMGLVVLLALVGFAAYWIGSGGLSSHPVQQLCYDASGNNVACGSIPFQAFGQPTASGVGSGSFTQICPNDNYNQNIAAKNVEDSTAEYLAASAVAVDRATGTVIISGTTTATGSGTVTYASLAVPCGKPQTLDIYLLASSTVGGGKASTDNSAIHQIVIPAWNTTEMPVFWRDSTLANATTTTQSGGLAYDPTSTTQTLGLGGTFSGYLDMQMNFSGSRYGIEADPVLNPKGIGFVVGVKYTTTEFTKNDVQMSNPSVGLQKVDCGSYDPIVAQAATANAALVCFVGRQVRSSDGLLRSTFSAQASLSNPSNDITVYLDDVVYFQDTDGHVKAGAFDSATTNKGATQTVATLDVA